MRKSTVYRIYVGIRESLGDRARYTANTLTDMSHIFPDPHIQTCLHRQSSGMHDRNDDKMRKK